MLDLVGSTPLVRLNRLPDADSADIWVKLARFNPGGSVKDRFGKAMIQAAEASGQLEPGMVAVEPTSGNTGMGLAMTAAVKGCRPILTMSDTLSLERRALFKACRAELILTPGGEGMKGRIEQADQTLLPDTGERYLSTDLF